jgi:glycerol-3-phosphate acyltransferase PlsY
VPTLWIGRAPLAYLSLAAVMFAFVLWRHRDNLHRMRSGTENRV